MKKIKNILVNVAKFQHRFAIPIIILVVIVTVFMAIGVTRISLQTDITQEFPQDLPIIKLNDRIRDKFAGQDTVFIVITLDESLNFKGAPKDIREPIIMYYLIMLDQALRKESSIIDVSSAATFLEDVPLVSIDSVKMALDMRPQAKGFFSKDFKTTMMFITADVGSSENKIIALSDLIEDKVDALSMPPGAKLMITGDPPLQVLIFNLLKRDAIFTILLASAIIIVLLFILEKSFTKGFLIFLPLFIGLVWTLGTMGWLGLKISIATAGIGAMILGLGVEYGVFMLTRYNEEKARTKTQVETLSNTIPSVGAAILGSGSTTIAGFLALTLSSLPLLQKLGFSLALGIFYSLFAAVFVMPVFMVVEEKLEYNIRLSGYKKLGKKLQTMRDPR